MLRLELFERAAMGAPTDAGHGEALCGEVVTNARERHAEALAHLVSLGMSRLCATRNRRIRRLRLMRGFASLTSRVPLPAS